MEVFLKMKFFIEHEEIVSAVSTVEKFVPSKSTIPILSGIKFFACEDSLYLSATDLDMGIEYKIPSDSEKLQIESEGAIVIGSKILSEMVRRIPLGMVEFNCQDKQVDISSGDFKMVLPCFDAQDFPDITGNEMVEALELSQGLFKEMIKQTIFARADDTTSRPQLTGLLLDYKDNILNVVALDGFRIAWRYEEINSETSDFKTIVPGDTLMEISRIFSDDQKPTFKIYSGKNRVEFVTEKTVISSRILGGNFIDYVKVMEVDPKTVVDIQTDALHSAVERAHILAREGKNNLITFHIAQNNMQVEVESELGNIYDNITCSVEGEELLIAFNARFFIDVLRTISVPQIRLNFCKDTGPCIIQPQGAKNHKNFILPVKLRSDNY